MKPVPLTNPITTFLPKFQGGPEPTPPPTPLLDPRMCSGLLENLLTFSSSLKSLSANFLSLEEPKIYHLGQEYKLKTFTGCLYHQ